jgi:hypothetical protein
VTAIAAGNATITAAASTGQSAAASVSVAAPAAAISGLQVSPSAASVQQNQTVTIVPTVNKGGAAVAVAYTYASSTASVATVTAAGVVTAVGPGIATITVTATGTGTGFTSATLTAAAAITVTALPTGLTSLNVTPSTLALVTNGTAQLFASAQQPAGAAAAVITYGTTAPAVATVSATGLVTAIGQGTAVITVSATSPQNDNFAAATLTGTVSVTVSPGAQISISSITGPLLGGILPDEINIDLNTPVDVNNVARLIRINTALVTNGQQVTAVSAWICRVGETVAECATRSGTPAAQQSFGSGGAASGTVSLTINTADFTVASDFSSATAKFANGQNVIVATVSTSAGLNSANSSQSILNFTNRDTFAGRHVPPTNNAIGTDNLTWYGGPGTAGIGSFTVVPVMYTPGRTVTRATVGMSTPCDISYEFVAATDAKPWTVTYGVGKSKGTFRSCAATEQTFPVGMTNVNVYSAIDNAQDEFGSAGSWATTTTSSTAVRAPANVRVDYQAPDLDETELALGSQNGSSNNWINASFKLDSIGNSLYPGSDLGVGLALVPRIEVQGCPWVDASKATPEWTAMATRTGADLAECESSAANNVYEARYIAIDRLGNQTDDEDDYSYSQRFGVDKTAPSVRYASSTRDNSSILATTIGDSTLFQVEAIDERSGLNADVAGAADHFLVRANSISSDFRSGKCMVGTYPRGKRNAGGSFITAPNCLMEPMSGNYEGSTTEGYSLLPRLRVSSEGATYNDGYYTYRARVRDEAGNEVMTALRSVLLQTSAPYKVTPDDLVTPLGASYLGAFTGVFRDTVETAAYGLRLQYRGNGGENVFGFPMVATTAVTFNNTITRDSVSSLTTPFTSGVRLYTNIEHTDFLGDVLSSPTQVDSLFGHGLFATNFGGNSTTNFSTLLTGITTFDGTKWATKDSTLRSFVFDTSSTSGFNSPAGGLKARAAGTLGMTKSPFARVDFYHLVDGSQAEYAGSVDGTTTACISSSQTCGVYVSSNADKRSYTYVLRTVGTGSESSARLPVGGIDSGTWYAVGVHKTGGRVLLSTGGTFEVTPEELNQ